MFQALWMAAVVAAQPDAGVTKSKMHEMFDALLTLETLAAGDQLRDAKNEKTIAVQLATLRSLQHAFSPDAASQEPAITALSTLFGNYAAETHRRFNAHELDGLGFRLKTFTAMCFACHSRERASSDFADFEQRTALLNLPAIDRAQVLAATRQFDRSLAIYEEVLRAPIDSERSILVFSRAMQDALSIVVRVKDDPPATLKLLQGAMDRRDLPVFLKQAIEKWLEDALSWQKERFVAISASPDELIRRAKRLISQNNGDRSLLPDERSDVSYLRASAYLNLALGKNPRHKNRSEALYLLGVASGALKSPLLRDVDLLFFETCIRESPKTVMADRCFQQLSQRIYLGYTGSSGVHVPDDELDRLAQLRALLSAKSR